MLLSSETDPYQHLEEKTKLTRSIINKFSNSRVVLEILTKSPLVLRNIDKKIAQIRVGVSMSFVYDDICRSIERGTTNYKALLETLKALYYEEYLKIYSDKAYYYKFWENVKNDIEVISMKESVINKIKFFFYHSK